MMRNKWLLVLAAELSCTPAVFAQLNQNCTVSISNRNAQVDANGNWRIDNVPIGFGPAVARATCVNNGVTQSGQSSRISMLPNIVNGFDGTILLTPPPPIPMSLQLSTATTTLTTVGATAQLAVAATYPDNSTGDVTPSVAGTVYNISNPAIATITAEGKVQAVSPGTVIVQANNSGAQGMIALTVSFGSSTDTDGDGIPDAVELANGLNPLDPTDALLDFDGDGLTNLEEYHLGTNMQNPDTDGDGIPDRLELLLGLNPLVADVTTTLQGHVVTATGAPVAGATVSILQFYSTTTDTNGAFRIAYIPAALGPLTVWAVSVSGSSLLQGSAGGVLPVQSGTTDTGNIVVTANNGTVQGVVTNAQSQPVAGALVTVTFASVSRQGVTDSNGYYRADGVPFLFNASSGSTQIVATAVQVSTGATGTTQVYNSTVSPGATFATLNIQVLQRGSVTGTVYQQDGVTPAAFAFVTITNGPASSNIQTDRNGRYTLGPFPAGHATLEFTTGNYPFTIGFAGVQVLAGSTVTQNLTIPGIGTLTVTVTNGAGAPVAGVYLLLKYPFDVSTGRLMPKTGADGTSSATNVTSGTFSVFAEDTTTGLAKTLDATLTAGGSTSVAIQLQATLPGTLRGTITLSDGFSPVPNPDIFATQTDSSGNVQSFYPDSTDGLGNYVFSGLPLGQFTLIAQDFSSGLTATAQAVLVDLSTPVVVNFRMPPAAPVTGTVTDTSNNPFPGAQIYLWSAAGAFTRFGRTDATGSYFIDNVGFGAFNAQTIFPFDIQASTVGDVTAGGSTVTANITEPPLSTVGGTVYAADGVTPVPGAIVNIYNFDHSGYIQYPCCFSALADANGHYQAYPILGQQASAATGNLDIIVSRTYPDTAFGELRTVLNPGQPLTAANVAIDGSVIDIAGSAFNDSYFSGTYNLDGADGFRYDLGCNFSIQGGGTIDGRLSAAYTFAPSEAFGTGTGANSLIDNNSNPLNACYYDNLPYGRIGAGGRQIESMPYPYIGLQVSRKVFSPAAGGFARFLDVITNPTSVSHSVPVTATGFLGAGSNTRVYLSPSNTGNLYAVTDSQVCCSPVVGHVFAGPGAALAPTASHFVTGDPNISWQWSLNIAPGQTIILMSFTLQRDATNDAGAQSAAAALANLTDPNALLNMTATEKSQVVNFRIPQ